MTIDDDVVDEQGKEKENDRKEEGVRKENGGKGQEHHSVNL